MELIFEVAHDEVPLENNSILRETVPLGIAPVSFGINCAVFTFLKACTQICGCFKKMKNVNLFTCLWLLLKPHG